MRLSKLMTFDGNLHLASSRHGNGRGSVLILLGHFDSNFSRPTTRNSWTLGLVKGTSLSQKPWFLHWKLLQLGWFFLSYVSHGQARGIVIAFRSLITSSTLISTVSNLMAGLSKIKEQQGSHTRAVVIVVVTVGSTLLLSSRCDEGEVDLGWSTK